MAPKILHYLCFSFLLGITAVSREIENNAYAKFWGANKVHYGKCGSGVCQNNRNRDSLVNVCHSENCNICICMNTGDIKGFATLQNKLPPVKSAKVVTTCTLIKLSYQFGIFQPFIKENAQRAHTTIHISLNLLLPSQLSPYGSGTASLPKMIKRKYIYNQICNILKAEIISIQ